MKFRKKPVVIEAMQFREGKDYPIDIDYDLALAEWLSANQGDRVCKRTDAGIVIPTLEGEHLASPGDWIIRGVKGEIYPCKPDIFYATYEIAE
jgi:hypothetical protein